MSEKDFIKDFYSTYHDQITNKRINSPYIIRRKTHEEIYNSILKYITQGMQVLDAGCGEGDLSILMAKKGAIVKAIDISKPNVAAAKKRHDTSEYYRPQFQVADSENLPFDDNSFDYVVSNHVLEHLPNIEKGVEEIYRVVKRKAFIAVPTCLNLCSLALLGGDTYWRIGKRSLYGLPFGCMRVIMALLSGKCGVNEGYAGNKDIIHIFRFPWVAKAILEQAGFKVIKYEAQSIRMPYINLSFNRYSQLPFIRYMGIGTLFHVEK